MRSMYPGVLWKNERPPLTSEVLLVLHKRQSILAFTRCDDERPCYCTWRTERFASRLVVVTVHFPLVTRLVSTPRLCKVAKPNLLGVGRTERVDPVDGQ
jgi:hypothetical protein